MSTQLSLVRPEADQKVLDMLNALKLRIDRCYGACSRLGNADHIRFCQDCLERINTVISETTQCYIVGDQCGWSFSEKEAAMAKLKALTVNAEYKSILAAFEGFEKSGALGNLNYLWQQFSGMIQGVCSSLISKCSIL